MAAGRGLIGSDFSPNTTRHFDAPASTPPRCVYRLICLVYSFQPSLISFSQNTTEFQDFALIEWFRFQKSTIVHIYFLRSCVAKLETGEEIKTNCHAWRIQARRLEGDLDGGRMTVMIVSACVWSCFAEYNMVYNLEGSRAPLSMNHLVRCEPIVTASVHCRLQG